MAKKQKTQKKDEEVEKLEEIVDEQEVEIENKNQDLENQLKRALADYQNLERRVEEERRVLSELSGIILLEKFLPILDNLESASEHIKDEGLKIVVNQFKDILTQEGLEEIAAVGENFDPQLHEAIDTQHSEEDEGKVLKVQQKGYKINNRVVRPAKVIVSKKES